jgi:hypothetical protein
MAILRRAVDPRAAAGVDPKMKAVAVFQPRVAAPELGPLPSHFDAKADRIATPSDPHIGVPPPTAQHRKSRDAAARRERQTLSPPLARLLLQIDFEPKEISRVDQRRRGRWLGGQRSRCENAKGRTGRPELLATRNCWPPGIVGHPELLATRNCWPQGAAKSIDLLNQVRPTHASVQPHDC